MERKYDGALSGEMQRFVGRLGMELGDDYEEIVATDWDFGVVREKGRGLPPVRALVSSFDLSVQYLHSTTGGFAFYSRIWVTCDGQS